LDDNRLILNPRSEVAIVKKNRVLFLITFLSLSLFSVYCAYADTQADRLIERGIQFERENMLDKAITEYKKALELEPDNLMVKIRLAKILSWENEFTEALRLLNEVLEEKPYQPEALFRKAQILSWQGNYRESIATYQLYLIKEGNDPDALLGIARVSFWAGENEKAIEYLNRALAAGADEAEVRIELGKVYLTMDRQEEARSEFKRVLEINPDNSEAKRFLKGIKRMTTWEIAPVNFRWDIYPDSTMSTTVFSDITYHYKRFWDFILQYQNWDIAGDHDYTLTTTAVYRGIQKLYLSSGFGFTPDALFSPDYTLLLGSHYTIPRFLTAGMDFSADFYSNETLLTFSPEVTREFSDISYITLGYDRFIYTTGYSTGKLKLTLNLEYFNKNAFFFTFSYGGDVEVRDYSRRVFEFSTGISYAITENLVTQLTYGRIETQYGKTNEISYSTVVKW
jgi:tetratricopeptide (TPR) repeat protein